MIATMAAAGVSETLRADEAAAAAWHVIVVGAGPAGAAAAIRLARGGRRVLLVDRAGMPRSKVCGCCLSSTALAELRGLGFAADAGGRILGATPLERVRVIAAQREVTLPMPPGGTLSRESLDTQLVEAAIEAGVAWLPWVDVTAVAEEPSPQPTVSITCRPQTGHEAGETFSLSTDAAIIATGLADHVRVPGGAPRMIQPGSRIGVGTTLPAGALDLPGGELVMAIGRGGYCGIVQLEDGRFDVAAAIDRQLVATAGGSGPAAAMILRQAAGDAAWVSQAGEAFAAAPFQATPALTRSAAPVAGLAGQILRVGDAASYVEPFTGEGMGWALVGGRLAAEALLASLSPAAAYREAHAAFARQHHRRCRRIAAVLRHPWLVGAAIRVAAAAPWMAEPLLPLLVGTHRGQGACSG
jgi:flavin-dependent dehydrogenase